MKCPWCPVVKRVDTDHERRQMELHLDTHMPLTEGTNP